MTDRQIIQFLTINSLYFRNEMMSVNRGRKYHGKVSYKWDPNKGFQVMAYYVPMNERYK